MIKQMLMVRPLDVQMFNELYGERKGVFVEVDQSKNQLSNVFNKVQPVRGFEDVLNQIYDAIFNNQLKSGDRLPSERELASMFQVSRTTIREAIRVLEAEQVVEVKRGVNGGICIIEPKPDQLGRSLETLLHFRGATFDELAEFRTDFEGKNAYLAAIRATEEQIESIIHIANQFNDFTNEPNITWQELVELDTLFHEEIAYASHNQIYIAIMLGIQNLLRRTSLSLQTSTNMKFRKEQGIHLLEIAHAIRNRDANLARTKMMDHVENNISMKLNQQID
jgi:GntR family transcriptional regulator, transcriptional repressor for pyruvate dehydrogenase complex